MVPRNSTHCTPIVGPEHLKLDLRFSSKYGRAVLKILKTSVPLYPSTSVTRGITLLLYGSRDMKALWSQ